MNPLLAQTWRDLLFAHWPVKAAALQPWIPAGLELDRYEGEAWIGVVPFRMTGIRLMGTPALPFLSETLELNLRTYVSRAGEAGVFFFSLDAASRVAVAVARRFFHLPYFHARMSMAQGSGAIDYQSSRKHSPVAFRAGYRPTGEVAPPARPDTIEHFLTERYCFFTNDRAGRLYRGRVRHAHWPLQTAEAEFRENGLTLPWKIDLPDTKPLLHFSSRVDVAAWKVEAVDGARRF